MKETYEANEPIILQPHQRGQVMSTYNFPINNQLSVDSLVNYLHQVYDELRYVFKFNMSLGIILRHVVSGMYRYYKPYSNATLFPQPIYISQRSDIDNLKDRFQELNLPDYMLLNRPNTLWKPHLITNIRMVVYRSSFTLGRPVELPKHLLQNPSIYSLTNCKKTGKAFHDNLCMFRCLSLLHHKHVGQLETSAKLFHQKWLKFSLDDREAELLRKHPNKFSGVPFDKFPQFERCFEVNLTAFEMGLDKIASPLYKPRIRFKDNMYVNIHQGLASFIKNIQQYCKKFRCKSCKKIFKKLYVCTRHQLHCNHQTKLHYSGGFYNTPKSIFTELEEFGIISGNQDIFSHGLLSMILKQF